MKSITVTAILLLSLAYNISLKAQKNVQAKIDSLTKLAELAYGEGNMAEAFSRMQKVVDFTKTKLGEKDTLYADVLRDYSFVAGQFGKQGLQESALLKSADIYRELLGENSLKLAFTNSNLALLYAGMGKFDLAEQMHLSSLAILKVELGEEHPTYATALNNLASYYHDIGRMSQAEYYYKASLSIREKVLGKESYDYGTSLNNLGLFYSELNEYELAAPILREAVVILKNVLGEAHPTCSVILNNLSTVELELGNYEKAKALMEEVLAIRKKNLNTKHPLYGQALANLAVLSERTEHYEEALDYYEAAAKVYRQSLEDLDPNQLILRFNKAWCLGLIGDYEAAIEMTKALYEDQLEVYGKNHRNCLLSLKNLAYFYEKSGDLENARIYLIRGLKDNGAIIEKELIEEEWLSQLSTTSFKVSEIALLQMDVLYHLMSKQYAKSQDQKWLDYQYSLTYAAGRCLSKSAKELQKAEDRLRIQNKSAYFSERNLIAAIQLKNPSKTAMSLTSIDANKSLLLQSSLRASAALSFGGLPDSLIQKERKFAIQEKQLEQQLSRNPSATEEKELLSQQNELNQQRSKLEELLKTNYPKYFQLKYEEQLLKLEDLQAELSKESLMIEYLMGDSALYVYTISKEKVNLVSLPIERKDVQIQTAKLRRALSDYRYLSSEKKTAYEDYTKAAFWCYQNLLAPLLKEQSPQHLIIIADADLGQLPFECFLTAEVKGVQKYIDLPYLLKTYQVSYSYAAQLWLENKQKQRSSKGLKVFAAAASYNKGGNQGTARSSRAPHLRNLRGALEDLPAARAEVEGLASFLKGNFIVDSLANEAEFKSRAKDYGVIHLAMHGLLNEQNPILSSLAFTENGDSLEDNFLEAWEITNMELNAELVVLSACETGYGRLKEGEGIMSLARSFMYTGVSSLVVSLWQVNDASTAIIMQSFYKNLAKGMNKAEALQQSKLSYIRLAAEKNDLAAHPAFWAAFIQLEDSDPLRLSLQQSFNWWWGIGFAVIAIVLVLFFFIRKKART